LPFFRSVSFAVLATGNTEPGANACFQDLLANSITVVLPVGKSVALGCSLFLLWAPGLPPEKMPGCGNCRNRDWDAMVH